MIDLEVLASISPPVDIDPPAFRVVKTNVVVRSSYTSLRVPIRADVALVDGRLVARWQGPDGLNYCELDADADLDYLPGLDRDHPRDFDLLGGRSVCIAPHAFIRTTMECRGHDNWIELSLETEADKEVKRFLRDWPTVSAMLGVDGGCTGFRLFDPGTVRHQRMLPRDPQKLVVDWREYIQRHISGDHGFEGAFRDVPLTAAENFSLGLQPVEVQNRAATLTGSGWVRSRYHLPPEHHALIPAGAAGQPRWGVVEVITAIGGGRRPETLMLLAYEDALTLPSVPRP